MAQKEPTSDLFAGPGLGIRYIGDYCYAYSGKYSATTNDQIVLSFTSGADFIRGILQFNGFNDDDTPGGNRSAGNCTINLNDKMVVLMTVGNNALDAPFSERTELIIPPYTKVEAIIDADDNSADNWATVTFTGTVHAAD